MEPAVTNDGYFFGDHRYRLSQYIANQVGGSCFIHSAVDTVLSALLPADDLPQDRQNDDNDYVRTHKAWTAHFMRKYGESGGYNDIVVKDILQDLASITGLTQYESVMLLDRRADTWKKAGPNKESSKNKNREAGDISPERKHEYKQNMSERLSEQGGTPLNMYGSRTGHAMIVYRVNFKGHDMSVTFKDSRSLYGKKAGDQAPKPNTGSRKEIGLDDHGNPRGKTPFDDTQWVFPTYDIKYVVDLHAICLKRGQDHPSDEERRQAVRKLTTHFLDLLQQHQYALQEPALEFRVGETVEIKLDYRVEDSKRPLAERTFETYDGTYLPAGTQFVVLESNFEHAEEKAGRQYIRVRPVSAGRFPSFDSENTIIRADYFAGFREGVSVLVEQEGHEDEEGTITGVVEHGNVKVELKKKKLVSVDPDKLACDDFDAGAATETVAELQFSNNEVFPIGTKCEIKTTGLNEQGKVSVKLTRTVLVDPASLHLS
jgi:hypothetical protein